MAKAAKKAAAPAAEPKIKTYTVKELRDLPQKVPKVDWIWSEVRKGEQWVVTVIPDGEASAPRITQSHGKFYCYRDGGIFLGSEPTLAKAKDRCAIGEPNELTKRVAEWDREHKDEFPPFLRLTDSERKAWRVHYPQMTAAKWHGLAGGTPDPEAKARKAAMLGGEERAVTKAAAKTADLNMSAVIRRAKPGNPKKAGTDAHGRWEFMFGHEGKTVEQYIGAKGNPTTLKNAAAAGYIKLEG